MDYIEDEVSENSENPQGGSDYGTLSTDKVHQVFPNSGPRVFSTVNHIPRLRSNSGTSSHLIDIPLNMKGKRIIELTLLLEKSINDSIALPLACLENNLFDLCYEFYDKNYSTKPLMGVLATMHPITKLLRVDDMNNSK